MISLSSGFNSLNFIPGTIIPTARRITAITSYCSHTEASPGWLEPILHRIQQDRTAVLCPVIDAIDHASLTYPHGGGVGAVGSFHWTLDFVCGSVASVISVLITFT